MQNALFISCRCIRQLSVSLILYKKYESSCRKYAMTRFFLKIDMFYRCYNLLKTKRGKANILSLQKGLDVSTYISDEERKYLLLNFNKMKQQLSEQNGIKYSNRHFDSNDEQSPIPYEIRLRAPSLRTILKFKKKASRNSAQKIVDTYNALFTPSVDLESFLSVDIFERDRPQKLHKPISGFLSGEYHCFYLSDNYENEIHGGILEIYEWEGRYRCYLVMGLHEKHYFNTICSKLFHSDINLYEHNKIRSAFNQYRAKLPDVPECKNFSISMGEVTQLNQSVMIKVHDMNDSDRVNVFTLGTANNKNMKNFSGGLGIQVSPATEFEPTKVRKILAIRLSEAELLGDLLFEKLSTEELLDSFWMKILKMTPTEYGNIEIPDETVNKKIQSHIRKINRKHR